MAGAAGGGAGWTYRKPLQANYLLIEDWWAEQGHQGASWPAMNWWRG